MKSLIWDPLAKEQLASIFEYNQKLFGRRVAVEVMYIIRDTATLLKQNPCLGIVETKAGNGNYRYVVCKFNRIYYAIEDDCVRIALVWDMRQNPQRLRELFK